MGGTRERIRREEGISSVKKFIILFLLASSTYCFGRDRKKIIFTGINIGARVLDAYSTTYNLSHGARESTLPTSLARSKVGMYSYGASCVLFDWEVSSILAKHGHEKLGDYWILGDASQDAFAGVRNLFYTRRRLDLYRRVK